MFKNRFEDVDPDSSLCHPSIHYTLAELKHLNFATGSVRPVCTLKIMLALTQLPELGGSRRSEVGIDQEEA